MEVVSVRESLVLLVEVSTEVDLEDSTLLLNVIEVRLALLSVYALLATESEPSEQVPSWLNSLLPIGIRCNFPNSNETSTKNTQTSLLALKKKSTNGVRNTKSPFEMVKLLNPS